MIVLNGKSLDSTFAHMHRTICSRLGWDNIDKAQLDAKNAKDGDSENNPESPSSIHPAREL